MKPIWVEPYTSPQVIAELLLGGFQVLIREDMPKDEIRFYTRDRWGVPRFEGAITNCLPETFEYAPGPAPFRPEPPTTDTALHFAPGCRRR